MNKLAYEAKPYVCMATGTAAFFFVAGAQLPATILAIAGVIIWRLRHEYRKFEYVRIAINVTRDGGNESECDNP